MQRERLEAAHVQLQRRVVLLVRPARFLELRISFGPSFLAVEDDAVPKRIAPRNLFRSCFGREPQWLVNLVAFADIDPAQEINRPRHDRLAGQLESSRADENA